MNIQWRRSTSPHPKGTILLAHGYAEHSGRYREFIDVLAEAGYDVATYDHVGHGTSDGPRARVDVGALILDHVDARRAALARARSEDLFLFGHSMGGLVTVASAILDPAHLRGVVLSAPALLPLPHVDPAQARHLLPVARLFPGLPTASAPRGVLSRDPAVQDAFDADPLTYGGPVPLLTGATMVVQGDEVLRHARGLETPTLVLHGSADGLASLTGSRRLVLEALAADAQRDIHLRIIDGAYHELLNEPEGPGLMRDIIIWLREH